MKADGTDEKLFSNETLHAGRPAWSPDGTKLAFVLQNFLTSTLLNELYFINADGTGLVKLVDNLADSDHSPTWSPSGSQLAYIGIGGPSLDNLRTIYIVNTDGSGFYRLPGSPTGLRSVDWSPDGTKFLYATEREVFVMNADATGQTQLTTAQQTPDGLTTDLDPRWSPDGKQILLTRVTSHFSSTYVINADGSNLRKLFNFNASSASWSADCLSVVLTKDDDICTVNVDNTNFKCLTANHFDVTPNWQKLPNPNPTPTPTPAPRFSLSGRVTTDFPFFIPQISLTGPSNATIDTDPEGNYDFVNLPAGQYTLTPISIFHSFNPPTRMSQPGSFSQTSFAVVVTGRTGSTKSGLIAVHFTRSLCRTWRRSEVAQSPESEVLSKAAYTDAFVQRAEFAGRYNGLSNSAYVNALEQNAEITLGNKAALIAALDGNQKTRAQVLREIVESKDVEDRFFIRAFVAMQYFGYLRRDPDTIGYDNWVTTLTADPSNFRHMIFGFLYSSEYRGRFGP